jgi:hypothetical protein
MRLKLMLLGPVLLVLLLVMLGKPTFFKDYKYAVHETVVNKGIFDFSISGTSVVSGGLIYDVGRVDDPWSMSFGLDVDQYGKGGDLLLELYDDHFVLLESVKLQPKSSDAYGKIGVVNQIANLSDCDDVTIKIICDRSLIFHARIRKSSKDNYYFARWEAWKGV